jgi:hypothetical protein
MIAALRELRRMNVESRVVSTVTETFNQLARQKDLSPRNPNVNRLLSHLVQTLVDAEEKDFNKNAVLSHPVIKAIRPHLLDLLSRAEYEMEMHFSGLFNKNAQLNDSDLNSFWYRDNYRDLIAQEVRGLKAHTDFDALLRDERPAVFVGAGPLPLSAIDLYKQTGKKCVCVELDPAAARNGQGMIDRLGLSDAITYVTADGRDVDYGVYSLIMVASLVHAKAEVFARIHDTAPQATVAVRSAEGLKTLLYQPVDIADIEGRGFKYRGMAQADKRTVNATCFFTRGAPKP